MDAKKTILHVEDARLWREYVMKLLGSSYEVVSCPDCIFALNWLHNKSPDLVILDHLLPGSGPFSQGMDFCSHLKKTFPAIPVIIYTGAWFGVDTVDRQQLGQKSGAVVVFKDVRDPELDHLRARVDELLSVKRQLQ